MFTIAVSVIFEYFWAGDILPRCGFLHGSHSLQIQIIPTGVVTLLNVLVMCFNTPATVESPSPRRAPCFKVVLDRMLCFEEIEKLKVCDMFKRFTEGRLPAIGVPLGDAVSLQ